MRNKIWYPVVYMFVVTAFFSSVLIGFARMTSDRVKANKRLAFETAVLEVFSIGEDMGSVELHGAYVAMIKEPVNAGDAYLLINDGLVGGYAVPIEGKGFWATIKGVVGFEVDRQTISGVSFYEQNETPGLGGKIVEEEFCRQFVGRVIIDGDKPFGIRPFGSDLKGNEIHAITGATQTCGRLEKLINEDLTAWKNRLAGEVDR